VPNSSIKNEKMYEDLRKDGNSKEKVARISNAAAARGTKSVGRKGGKAGWYWRLVDGRSEKAGQGTWRHGLLRPDERQVDR
jgi:hypothetical protein